MSIVINKAMHQYYDTYILMNEPRQGQNILFTNKILRRIECFRRKKVQNFLLRSLIMILYRLPQVSGQYKSSWIRGPVITGVTNTSTLIVPTKYVIDRQDIEISKNSIYKTGKLGNFGSLARNNLWNIFWCLLIKAISWVWQIGHYCTEKICDWPRRFWDFEELYV